ncbi:MAG TPA: archease [Actinomycetes bacterium]|nr:archease [Actinomycetes bacterium]
MAGFELLAHTADVGVRARGATLEEVFEQATLGLAEVLGALARGGPPDGERVAVEVTAGDHGALLVDWLNEVLWLHEARQHAAVVAVRVDQVTGDRAAGSVTFSTTGPPADGTSVKAATYHQLRVARDGGGWLAEVYLDV